MINTPENILFLDIETVPQCANFDDLSPETQQLWDKKTQYIRKPDETASKIYGRAGIWAEFGKIVCISVGFIYYKNQQKLFRVKSFYSEDEKKILLDFMLALKSFGLKHKDFKMCAHNGKEFDFPYIARRILINELRLPQVFDVGGKKPWEVPFLDTLEMWRFGDYKNYTSLNLLANIFGIPSPKDDIDGSMVADVYYNQKDLQRIARYCEKDTLTVAQLYLRFKSMSIIEAQNVIDDWDVD